MLLQVSSNRKGSSLVELAFALLIVGAVLGVIWKKTGQVYQNMEVQKAISELQVVVNATRLKHPTDRTAEGESVPLIGLPPDMIGNFNGQTTVFNPWHGLTTIIPGNAIGWGADQFNDEFTIRMSGIPSSSCTALTMAEFKPNVSPSGLVGIYISHEMSRGQLICLSLDSYCQTTVTAPPESFIKKLCEEHNPVSVMFTFSTH